MISGWRQVVEQDITAALDYANRPYVLWNGASSSLEGGAEELCGNNEIRRANLGI